MIESFYNATTSQSDTAKKSVLADVFALENVCNITEYFKNNAADQVGLIDLFTAFSDQGLIDCES
jgi:hypothetical protein